MPDSTFRALVVDDDSIARRTVMWALANEKFECTPATDGVDAMDKLKDMRFDLVVTDLRMPYMHGHALISELLAGEVGYKPLIVAHSCIDDPKISKDLMLRGIDDVISKPTNYAVLAAKLKGRVICHRSKMEALSALPQSYSPDDVSPSDSPNSKKSADVGSLTEGQFDMRLAEVLHIPPISDHYRRVINLISQKDCDLNTVCQFIASDACLLVEVMRAINSGPYTKPGQHISNLKEATERLGMKRISESVNALNSLSSLVGLILPWIDKEVAYKRSVAGYAAAKRILELNPQIADPNSIVNAALLYPYCRIVVGTAYCHLYEKLIKLSIDLKTPLENLERDVFPRSPTEATFKLLQNWQIPTNLYQPLFYADATFESFSVLREVKRTSAVLLKSAIILGELAVNHWDPWERKPEFPSFAFLKPYNLSAIESLIENVRNDLGSFKFS